MIPLTESWGHSCQSFITKMHHKLQTTLVEVFSQLNYHIPNDSSLCEVDIRVIIFWERSYFLILFMFCLLVSLFACLLLQIFVQFYSETFLPKSLLWQLNTSPLSMRKQTMIASKLYINKQRWGEISSLLSVGCDFFSQERSISDGTAIFCLIKEAYFSTPSSNWLDMTLLQQNLLEDLVIRQSNTNYAFEHMLYFWRRTFKLIGDVRTLLDVPGRFTSIFISSFLYCHINIFIILF